MRILTTADFIKGKIPRIEDFIPALRQFESDCVDPFLEKKVVVGSFAYGSVKRADCNVASDIDYLMIIADNSHKENIRDATQRAYKERNVYIQTRVINQKHAKLGIHTINEPFRQHLELSVAKYGHKGENPLEILKPDDLEIIVSDDNLFKEPLRRSMAFYITKLDNGFTTFPTSHEQYVDFLKDIMEKPFHAMRCAIQYYLQTIAPNGADNFNDTKDELIKIYKTLEVSNKGLIADIDKLRATAKDYVNLLESRLESKQRGDIPSSKLKKTYSVMLDKIMDCYPQAYHFISRNAEFMNK